MSITSIEEPFDSDIDTIKVIGRTAGLCSFARIVERLTAEVIEMRRGLPQGGLPNTPPWLVEDSENVETPDILLR